MTINDFKFNDFESASTYLSFWGKEENEIVIEMEASYNSETNTFIEAKNELWLNNVIDTVNDYVEWIEKNRDKIVECLISENYLVDVEDYLLDDQFDHIRLPEHTNIKEDEVFKIENNKKIYTDKAKKIFEESLGIELITFYYEKTEDGEDFQDVSIGIHAEPDLFSGHSVVVDIDKNKEVSFSNFIG